MSDPLAFTSADRSGHGPGVWPTTRGLLPRHFQLIGDNQRALVIEDAGAFADVGGVHVTCPDHLDDIADRLHDLAGVMRARNIGKAA